MHKTFLLGVGAQKSGTTWLHQFLARQANTDLGFAKEYHIWDALFTPECARHIVRLRDTPKSRKLQRRWLMQRRPSYYFAYFSSLLRRSSVSLTGDITPAYSSLDGNTLKLIRDGFAARGVDCKVVFLMRDPVERCISAVAHERNKQRLPAKLDYTDEIRAYAESRQCEIRTNYARTIANLEAAFAPSDLYYGIYEQMFEEAEIRRLAAFLGVSPSLHLRDVRVNVSPKLNFDPEVRGFVARHYAPVYEFAATRFPGTPTQWKGFEHLG